MKLYAIRDWAALFENNRSRTVKDLAWVPIPNRHDGENYSLIMAHKNSAEIFAAWVLMLQVASRCQPRGRLVRDNQKPHTSSTLAIKTRAPEKWFALALEFLEKETDWLEIVSDCQEADTQLRLGCHPPDEEVKGTERREVKETHPSLESVKLACDKTGVCESDAIWFWNKCQANGWTNGGRPIKSWPHTIAAWKAAGYLPSQKKPALSQRPTGGNI